MKNKTGLELGISRSSGHKTSSESNKVVFESVQNLHLIVFASQLITSYITPSSFVILNLESLERKKIRKI